MRLIDADAFKEYITCAYEEMKHLYNDGGKFAKMITESFCKDIDEQTTIEAVEIVRCSDCEHWDMSWQNDNIPNYHYCPLTDGMHRCDFYCAYAKRRVAQI